MEVVNREPQKEQGWNYVLGGVFLERNKQVVFRLPVESALNPVSLQDLKKWEMEKLDDLISYTAKQRWSDLNNLTDDMFNRTGCVEIENC